jgi:hypothetical protein
MAMDPKKSFNTEMSDMSSFSEHSSEQSIFYEDPTPKVFFRTAQMQNFKDYSEEYNPKVVTKNQIEEFKHHIKTSILENIIAGLGTLKEDENPKTLYDHKLGYGEAPINTHEGIQTVEETKAKATNFQYIWRHLKEFFAFNRQAAGATISAKDPNAEALVIEGQILGHPDVMRKIN